MERVNNVKIEKTRIDYLDTAKGIGIILVVAGHLFAPSYKIYTLIFGMHMPLFFMISGIFYMGGGGTGV